MKNIIKSLALAAVVLVSGASFTACKKGENDPGISLKSRKGRLVGEWKLSKGLEKYTDISGTETTTYTETSANVTYTDGSSPNNYGFTETLTIEKDGTFTRKQIVTYTGSSAITYTEIGRWNFMSANKSAELKNKEAVVFSVTSSSSTAPGSTPETDSNPMDGIIYSIDQLKNKEIIFTAKTTMTNPNVSWEASMTYTQD